MDTFPSYKRQKLSAAATDVQADTAEVLSGASQDSHVSTEHSIQPADAASPQSKPRQVLIRNLLIIKCMLANEDLPFC